MLPIMIVIHHTTCHVGTQQCLVYIIYELYLKNVVNVISTTLLYDNSYILVDEIYFIQPMTLIHPTQYSVTGSRKMINIMFMYN